MPWLFLPRLQGLNTPSDPKPQGPCVRLCIGVAHINASAMRRCTIVRALLMEQRARPHPRTGHAISDADGSISALYHGHGSGVETAKSPDRRVAPGMPRMHVRINIETGRKSSVGPKTGLGAAIWSTDPLAQRMENVRACVRACVRVQAHVRTHVGSRGSIIARSSSLYASGSMLLPYPTCVRAYAMHARVRMHASVPARVDALLCACVQRTMHAAHQCVYMFMHLDVCVCACVYVCVYVCVRTCLRACVHVCVCACVCVCVHQRIISLRTRTIRYVHSRSHTHAARTHALTHSRTHARTYRHVTM